MKKKNNEYVYCRDLKPKCWDWSKNKKKKKISQDGVVSFKLSKKELEAYLEELEHKEIKRVQVI